MNPIKRVLRAGYLPIVQSQRRRTILSDIREEIGEDTLKAVQGLRVASLPLAIHPIPDVWNGRYALQKTLGALGLKVSQFEPRTACDVVINWQLVTDKALDVEDYLRRTMEHSNIDGPRYVLNGGCNDISKVRVGQVTEEVFGHALDVDPLTHHGPVVRKSDMNGQHDGVVLQAPISLEDLRSDVVYNRLIDNTSGDEVIDHRVIYVGEALPLYYAKWRPSEVRFANKNSRCEMAKLHDEFSKDEIEGLNACARKLGADFGEMDVLRDKKSGQIFVVDFARSSASPPSILNRDVHREAVLLMAVALVRNILAPIATGENTEKLRSSALF